MKYQVYVLNGFKILKDGNVVDIPYKKLSLIITYLAIEGESSRDYLSELFWESYDNQNAKKNLRNAVYNIKKILGDDFLICNGRTSIKINEEIIDYIDYQELIDSTKQTYIDNFNPLLKGIGLSNLFSLEKWYTKINDQLLDLYIEYSNQILADYMSNDEFDKALKIALSILEYNTYDEYIYRLVMKIYRMQGRYTEAINLYQNLVKILENDFSINPESNTKLLFEEISMLRASEHQSMPNNELDTFKNLTSAITEVINENKLLKLASALFLYGEAGVGKNESLDYILKHNFDFNVLKIKCSVKEQKFAFSSVYQLLKTINDEYLLEEFSQFFKSNFETISSDAYYYGASLQDLLVSKLSAYFSANHSVIIINEFCHMDNESKSILNTLYEKSDLLFILVSRKHYCELQKGTISCNNICVKARKMQISPWNEEQLQSYLTTNDISLQDDEIANIYKISGGNKLLVDCIIKGNLEPLKFSAQVIEESILNIDSSARKLLNLISVFSSSVNFSDLQSIYADSDLKLIEQLEYLVTLNLLEVESTTLGNSYAFKHNILKEYVYSKINKIKLEQYHYVIASYYDNKYGSSKNIQYISIIAYHYDNSSSEIRAIYFNLLYLSLISAASLKLFPNINTEVSTRNEIIANLKKLEKRVDDYPEFDNKNYNKIYKLLYFIKLHIKVSSFHTRGVEELIEKLKAICTLDNDFESINNIYLWQLFYAENINDQKLFRSSLDYLSETKIYPHIKYRMEAYYYYISGEVNKAIEVLENYLINYKQHGLGNLQLFATRIYLASFFIASKNYKRALIHLDYAEKIAETIVINNHCIALLNGYKMICYYNLKNFVKAQKLVDITANALENSNMSWKKSLLYSYIYVLSNDDNETYYNLTKKYFRKTITDDEQAQINKNLSNKEVS